MSSTTPSLSGNSGTAAKPTEEGRALRQGPQRILRLLLQDAYIHLPLTSVLIKQARNRSCKSPLIPFPIKELINISYGITKKLNSNSCQVFVFWEDAGNADLI